jgi:uncharacterized protein HemY
MANKYIQFGDYLTARQLIDQALPLQLQLDLKNVIPYSLTAHGQLAYWQGNFQPARTYFQAS